MKLLVGSHTFPCLPQYALCRFPLPYLSNYTCWLSPQVCFWGWLVCTYSGRFNLIILMSTVMISFLLLTQHCWTTPSPRTLLDSSSCLILLQSWISPFPLSLVLRCTQTIHTWHPFFYLWVCHFSWYVNLIVFLGFFMRPPMYSVLQLPKLIFRRGCLLLSVLCTAHQLFVVGYSLLKLLSGSRVGLLHLSTAGLNVLCGHTQN